jgi:putative transposase
MCRALKVSASGYYAWRQRPDSLRRCENRRLLAEIRTIHAKSTGTYGSLRVQAELLDNGHSCGRHRIARLMRTDGLHGIPQRRFRRTTTSGHQLPVAPNRLKQDFTATAPNQRWVADITYVRTGEGWLYLAVILDLYSRKVVGWSTSARLQRDLVLEALKMAIGRRLPSSSLIHHSDRGSQYASLDFQKALSARGILCSMSGRGNCYDNAVAESFFATLKRERVHRRVYRTRSEARMDLFQYLEVFYNRQRRHGAAGQRSPDSFERLPFSRKTQTPWPHPPAFELRKPIPPSF